jgi:RNA polymerase sigma-70 factor (ECF subfamily)
MRPEDGARIEAIYRQYGPMVLRRCLRLLGNEDDALDVAQEVFVQVLRHRHRLSVDRPSSLLYRIATNLCLNWIRSRRRRPEEGMEEQLLYELATTPNPDANLLLDRLFKRQNPSTRVMAVMHFLDGLTLEQVAREVNLSVSGVRKRLDRLRRTLRQLEGFK